MTTPKYGIEVQPVTYDDQSPIRYGSGSTTSKASPTGVNLRAPQRLTARSEPLACGQPVERLTERLTTIVGKPHT